MSAPLIIEFAGVPGSGKTSLSGLVAEKLRSEGREVRTVIDAARVRSAEGAPGRILEAIAPPWLARPGLWWIFYCASTMRGLAILWKSRRSVLRLAEYQARRPISLRLKGHIAWWFLQLAGRHSYLQASRPLDAILFDDGYVHRSVALFSSPTERPSEGAIRDYLAGIPEPSMIVQVLAPLGTCVERVTDRGIWGHSRHMTEADLREYLGSAQHVLDIAVDEARSNDVPLLAISNDDAPLDETASRVAEKLGDLLDSVATEEKAT